VKQVIVRGAGSTGGLTPRRSPPDPVTAPQLGDAVSRVLRVLVVVLAVVIVGGLVAIVVGRVRHAAALLHCRNNLRQAGLALHSYHDARNHFPPATVPTKALLPEQRLSWWVEIWPAYVEGGMRTLLDRGKAWDSDENFPPRVRVRMDDANNTRDVVMGSVLLFRCPIGPEIVVPNRPCLTHYVGIAGVGDAAAERPLTDPLAGFFGHDRKISHADIKDGAATTLMVIEATDGGPWTAGGKATVRGLAPGKPYLGPGGQFGGVHRSAMSDYGSPVGVTPVLFADASVRRIANTVSPSVLEALATIAGGEPVGPVGRE
jgi:hypothetical protein